MYPFQRYMETHPQPFPHPRDHNAYPYPHPFPYYPSWDSMPSQMNPESTRPPSTFGPWPHNATNTGHEKPWEGNGCCNHAYPPPPGYYSFKPPHPQHFQSHPQPFYHGPYPPYPDPYPFHFVPPPPYSVDRPYYDYDRAKNHCCGCPNHSCHKKDNMGVKIEEHNPETEQKGSESSTSVQAPNNPYPVFGAPSGHIKDKEPNFFKASELQPGYWNGWFPMDINSLKNFVQGGDEKRGRQSDDEKTQLPLPLIQMPGYSKQEEPAKDVKDIDVSPKATEEPAPKYKIIPLKLFDSDNWGEKPGVAEDGSPKRVDAKEVAEKEKRIKTIPVKQKEESSEKEVSTSEKEKKKDEVRKMSDFEKQKEGSGLKKPTASQQQSQAKSSKLPPICLRVDPLPRRKNENGTSKSPNPPYLKDKEKERTHQENKEQGPTVKELKDEAPRKKEIKVTNVQEKADRGGPDSVPVVLLKGTSSKAVPEEAGMDDDKHKAKGALDDKNASDKNDVEDQKNKEEAEARFTEKKEVLKEMRSLSQLDAAIRVQSAYRGYEVRRWKPLEKLRNIAQVRDQANNVRKEIQSLPASSELQNSKQRTIIGETIMNPLLQLDTIQGLHPSVREIRKSVTKELVCLQEQLDSLGGQVTKDQGVEKAEELQGGKVPDDQALSGISQAAVEQTSADDTVQPTNVNGESHQLPLKETEEEQRGDAEVIQEEGSTQEEKGSEQLAQEASSLQGTLLEEAVEPLMEKEMVSSKCKEHGGEQPAIEGSPYSEVPLNIVNEEHVRPLESLNHVADAPHGEDIKLPCSDGVLEWSKEHATLPRGDHNHQELELDDKVTHPEIGESHNRKIVSETEDLVALAADRSVLEEVSKVSSEELRPREEPVERSELASSVKEAIDISPGEHGPDSELKKVVQEEGEDQTMQLDPKMLSLVDFNMDISQVNTTGNSEYVSFTPSTTIESPVEQIGDDKKTAGVLTETTPEEAEPLKEDQDSEVPENIANEESGKMIYLKLEDYCETGTEDHTGPLTRGVVVDHLKDLGAELPINEGADIGSVEADNLQRIETLAPESGQIPVNNVKSDEHKLLEENKILRKMLERMLEAGKEQLDGISKLNGRVKDLERKLSQKKKVRVKRNRTVRSSPRNTHANGPYAEKAATSVP